MQGEPYGEKTAGAVAVSRAPENKAGAFFCSRLKYTGDMLLFTYQRVTATIRQTLPV